jgi:hypothetical protein
MPISRDQFDPLALVVDWLDACRLGELNALLDLYDERATLECDCECVCLTGRKSIAAYWAPKLESKILSRLHPNRHDPDRRWGSGRSPKLRRQAGPNSLSHQSGQDTPHKLRPTTTWRRLKALPNGLVHPHLSNYCYGGRTGLCLSPAARGAAAQKGPQTAARPIQVAGKHN